jgi:hypothetical protein
MMRARPLAPVTHASCLCAYCAQGFKATPSLAAVEERFKAFDACELDATADGCDGAL